MTPRKGVGTRDYEWNRKGEIGPNLPYRGGFRLEREVRTHAKNGTGKGPITNRGKSPRRTRKGSTTCVCRLGKKKQKRRGGPLYKSPPKKASLLGNREVTGIDPWDKGVTAGGSPHPVL